MSVRVAPQSVARGVGAKHTQRYEALKRELEEFCAKGPQVRNLEWSCIQVSYSYSQSVANRLCGGPTDLS